MFGIKNKINDDSLYMLNDMVENQLVNAKKNKRKASYQKLQQEVIYKHKMPHSITDGKSQRFVYVIPKFVLGGNEKLMLELKELKGGFGNWIVKADNISFIP